MRTSIGGETKGSRGRDWPWATRRPAPSHLDLLWERRAWGCAPGSRVGLNHARPSPQPQGAGPCCVQCLRESSLSPPLRSPSGPFGACPLAGLVLCAVRQLLSSRGVAVCPLLSGSRSASASRLWFSLTLALFTLYVSFSSSVSDSASRPPALSSPSSFVSLPISVSLSHCLFLSPSLRGLRGQRPQRRGRAGRVACSPLLLLL